MAVWLPLAILVPFALGFSLWTCPIMGATGCRCPGCGMTRGVAALGRGDFAGSFALHPFTLAFAAGWLVLVAYELFAPRRSAIESAVSRVERRLPVSTVVLGASLVFGIARFVTDAVAAIG
mgnify:CR=1 FL=1